ncbi:MAG: glycosyltransferase family 4 protein [Candidatus Omnitrophica bacterium]|nr:glycosyltransferase family 4 protein [Candidatus Omnitrophota bacterium]
MKICYIAGADSWDIEDAVKYFTSKGHEIIVVSDRKSAQIKGINMRFMKEWRFLLKPSPPIFAKPSWLDEIMRFIAKFHLFFAIRRTVKREKPDILHAFLALHYGTFAAFCGFHPLLMTIFGPDINIFPQQSGLAKRILLHNLSKADKIITYCETSKRKLIDCYKIEPEKIIKMSWGIDLNIFHKGYQQQALELRKELDIPDQCPVVLSNRRLLPHYRIEKIMESIPYILEKEPGAIFVFIRGEKPDEADLKYEIEIEDRARNLKIFNSIRIIKRLLQRSEMAVYLNMSEAMVSIPKTDQFANSIQEAMVCGVIPIVGKLEVYREYLKDGKNAFFVNAEDEQDIAEKIVYCLRNKSLKKSFSEINSKIIVEKEDTSKQLCKLEDFYKSFVNQ